MTDILDRAGELEQRDRDAALARQAAAESEHERPFEIEGVRVCLDCFEPIAPARLAANHDAVRCVECQQDSERRRAHGMV